MTIRSTTFIAEGEAYERGDGKAPCPDCGQAIYDHKWGHAVIESGEETVLYRICDGTLIKT